MNKHNYKLVEGIDFVYSKYGYRIDPKEEDPRYKDILHKAWLEAENELGSWEWPDFVIETPKQQKKILKERYSIDYKTTRELNPEVKFSIE